MSAKLNVPQLRFKEFSGEWEEKRIGSLCETFKSGNSITSENIRDNGLYPVYGGNGLRGYADSYTHNGFYFLIGRQGALCGNINRSNGKAFMSEHAIVVDANETSDTEWLAQRLDYYNLNRLSESSAQPGLAVNKLVRFKIFVPSKQEQEKIASFLSSVDTKIEQLTSKVKLLQEYKKGVMQKIFSQEIRFHPKGISSQAQGTDDGGSDKVNGEAREGTLGCYPEWVEKKIGDILRIRSGKDYKHLKNGNIPVYGTGGYMTSVDDYLYDGQSVCIGRKGTINKPILVSGKFWTVDTLFYTDTFNNILPKYFYYFSLTINWLKYNEGTTLPSLSKKTIENIKITLPQLEEQTKIVNFLSSIDSKIEQTQKQIDSTKEFKKALLQQMFV